MNRARIKRVLKAPGFLGYIALFVSVFGIIAHLEDQAQHTTASFLNRVDTISVGAIEASSRLQHLTDLALQQQITSATLQSSREDIRMQARTFYAAILAVLISLIFLKEVKQARNSVAICNIAIIVTVLMYSLDVHTMDLIQRQIPVYIRHFNTYQKLLLIQPDDTWYYTINYVEADSIQRVSAEWDMRIPRKVLLAISPSLEQVIYYFFPLVVLSWLRRINKRQLPAPLTSLRPSTRP